MMLTQLLGDNAVVEESMMLTDLVSGEHVKSTFTPRGPRPVIP